MSKKGIICSKKLSDAAKYLTENQHPCRTVGCVQKMANFGLLTEKFLVQGVAGLGGSKKTKTTLRNIKMVPQAWLLWHFI